MGQYQAYEQYKDSGVEWLGIIPIDWETCHLKRLAEISYGVGGEIDRGITEGINLLSLPNIQKNGEIFLDEVPKCVLDEAEKRDLLLRKGDLLFNWRNGSSEHLGKTVYFDLDGEWTHVSFLLRLRFDSSIESRYFHYMLNGLRITGFFTSSKAGVNNTFNLNELRNLKIIFPPKNEQKQIAQFLDYKTAQIDALIAKKEALLEKLSEQRSAIITQAVTKGLDPTVPMKDSGIEWLGEIPKHWDIQKAKYLARILRGKFTHRPRNDPRLYDGQYPFVQTGDVANADTYIRTFSQTLNEAGFNVSKEFPAGTLVMSIAANIGDMAILDFNACFPDSIIGFFPDQDVDLLFLYYLFVAMRKQLLYTAVLNTQFNLNVERVGNIFLVRPPVEEQNQIVEYLNSSTDKIKKQVEKLQQAIALLKEYRTALITNAVTGKIDVRDIKLPELDQHQPTAINKNGTNR